MPSRWIWSYTLVNTTDFRASQRSASGSESSGPSSRRLTEQELEIVRLREENRQRDEQLRAQSEYYASVHAQQQMLQVSPLHYYCLFIALHIQCVLLICLVNSY
jgi:hypothetical protein